MDNLLTVALEARHTARNHHRRYEITVGRDLFDDWSVVIRYGRIGQGGREERFAGTQVDEMKAVVRERLRRRLSAPQRIGVPYRLAVLSSAPGFEAAAWLPDSVMCKFGRKRDEDVE
jgi:predicted DNA-binding WGR domain protein